MSDLKKEITYFGDGKEESKHLLREVTIEEYYTNENDIIYWHYKFANDKHFIKRKTNFIEIPFLNIPSCPSGEIIRVENIDGKPMFVRGNVIGSFRGSLKPPKKDHIGLLNISEDGIEKLLECLGENYIAERRCANGYDIYELKDY